MSSLKDLARECGVSVATVSKALNGQSDISAATRDRVREAARRMGYVPNMAARAMKTNSTYNLGVLFVDERQSGLSHEYFSAVLDSFKVQVEKLGYDITFVNRNLGGRTMTYLEHCHYRGVDGAVIACVDFNDPQVVELVNSDVPVVTIDHVFNNRMAVLSDNVNGLSALVRYAYANGHRRIAFIHGERTAVTENRLAGFYKSCAELGLQVPEEYVRCGVYHDPDRCAEETRALLALTRELDFDLVGRTTALGEAILLARQHADPARPTALLLVTDGRNTAGNADPPDRGQAGSRRRHPPLHPGGGGRSRYLRLPPGRGRSQRGAG